MALSHDDMKHWLRVMRRQAEGLEDACASYNARGSRADLEMITNTADRTREAAENLEEWHR